MKQKNLSKYFGTLFLAALFAPCLVFSQIVYLGGSIPSLDFCAKTYWGTTFIEHKGDNNNYTPGNAPFFPIGNSRYGEFGQITAAKKPNMVIGYGAIVAPGSIGFGGDDIPRISIEADPKGGGSIPPQQGIATVAVNWGMFHGHYSADQLLVPYIDQLLKMGRPSKALDKGQAWLGDINSWQGSTAMFPVIKKGSASGGNWTYLPNRYIAFVWRAHNSRHPTKTMITPGQNSREGSADPSLRITGPGSQYKIQSSVTKITTDDVRVFSANSDEFNDFVKMEAYDGDNLLFEETSDMGMSSFSKRIQFLQSGIKTLIAIGTRKNGSQVCSRPVLLFVTGPSKGTDIIKIHSNSEGTTPVDNGRVIKNPEMELVSLGAELPTWTWGGDEKRNPPQVDGFYSNGTFNLSGNGQAIYMCWDRAGFATVKRSVKGDFVFYARLQDPGESPGSVGITVKASTSANSPVLDLRWDWYWATKDGNGVNWFNRNTPSSMIGLRDNAEKGECAGYPTTGGPGKICLIQEPAWNCLGRALENRVLGFTQAKGLWFAVQRTGAIYHLYVRNDNQTEWTKVSPVHMAQPEVSKALFPNFTVDELVNDEVKVGFSVAGVAQGAHMQFAKWDNVTLIYNQQEAASFSTGSVSLNGQKHFSTGDCYSGLSKCKSPGVQMIMDANGFPRTGLQLNHGSEKFAPTGKKLD